MRRIFLTLFISFLAFRALASIDLADFDTGAMTAMDDAAKELESGIRDKDVQLAVSNAEFVRDSLQWAADYFAQKKVGDAADWAKQGRDLAAAIAKSAAAKEFDAAYESFGDLKKNCKRCHDAYKPPSL